MKKYVLSIFLVIVMLINTSLPVFAQESPQINAQAAVLMEVSTKRVLYEKGMNEKIYPASMTKMLTALIALDYFDVDSLITVGNEVNYISLDSSKAGHIKNETLTIKNLLRGLIIPSGNDSAAVIAAAVAKKASGQNNMSYEECENYFADIMNEKAKELGAVNSNFNNPHGYHDDNHYSTAYDLALIGTEVYKNEHLREIAAERYFSGNGAGNASEDSTLITQNYTWSTHNMLISNNEYGYKYANGIKTGFTDEAGDCVAASAEKDQKQLIAIICNSEDPGRWTDAELLFDYGFDNFQFKNIQTVGDVIDTVSLTNHDRMNGDSLEIIVNEDVQSFISESDFESITKEITYFEEFLYKDENSGEIYIKAPISKDTKIGKVSYSLNGMVIADTDVAAARDVSEKSIVGSIKYFFKTFFDELLTLKGILILSGIILVIVLIILIIKQKNKRRRYNSEKYYFKNKRKK